jgi:hypothetical protein
MKKILYISALLIVTVYSCKRIDLVNYEPTEIQVNKVSESMMLSKIFSNGFNGCEPVQPIITTKAKSHIDGVRLTGNANQMEYAVMFVITTSQGTIINQAGVRKANNKTIPFTDYSSPFPVRIMNGIAPFVFGNMNVFEMYQHDDTHYRYRLNGTDVLEFETPIGAVITYMNIHTLIIAGDKFPLIRFYPAMAIDINNSYVNVPAGRNTYGQSNVGFKGNKQDSTLNNCEVLASSNIPKTPYREIIFEPK